MSCKDCIHYYHQSIDGIWCDVQGELYMSIKFGDGRGRSEPTNHSVTDSSICGDYMTT